MDSSLYITILVLVIILALFLFAASSSKSISKRRRTEILNQLNDIKNNIGLDINSANRDSVVRLDSLLSKVLQVVKGNKLSCGENLKLIKNRVKRDLYNDIWEYHKLRNRIVHENIDVNAEEAKAAYSVYYKLITTLIG